MAKRAKAKVGRPNGDVQTQPAAEVPKPKQAKAVLPLVAQPESGKREVVVDPPVRVRLHKNGAEGLVIGAERSAPTVNAGEVTDRQLDSASRDQTMYVVAIGDAHGTYAAGDLEVL